MIYLTFRTRNNNGNTRYTHNADSKHQQKFRDDVSISTAPQNKFTPNPLLYILGTFFLFLNIKRQIPIP